MKKEQLKEEISTIQRAKRALENDLTALEHLLNASAAPQLMIGCDSSKVYALPDTAIGRIIHKAILDAMKEKRHQIKVASEQLLQWL